MSEDSEQSVLEYKLRVTESNHTDNFYLLGKGRDPDCVPLGKLELKPGFDSFTVVKDCVPFAVQPQQLQGVCSKLCDMMRAGRLWFSIYSQLQAIHYTLQFPELLDRGLLPGELNTSLFLRGIEVLGIDHKDFLSLSDDERTRLVKSKDNQLRPTLHRTPMVFIDGIDYFELVHYYGEPVFERNGTTYSSRKQQNPIYESLEHCISLAKTP